MSDHRPDLSLFDLSGRTALVTGSGKGLGRALAEGLSRAGAHVIVHGRNQERTEEAAAAIARETGVPTSWATFDVTDEEAVNRELERIIQTAGAPDILVNNAGIQRRAPITEFRTEDWNDVLATNLTSAFFLSRALAPAMLARGSGKIINIGSVQSQLARPGIAPYGASKGAIGMLTKGLCADLGPSGIQVNAIAPGYFATELTEALVQDEDFSAWVAGRTPAGRWGDPADLQGAVVFLAGPGSDFINGQTLYIDGGMTSVV